MKRKIFILLLLASLSVVISGCTDKRPKYKNLGFEFSMHYIPGWEVKEKMGSAIVAFVRPIQGKFDLLQETLTVTVDDLTQSVLLSEYTQAAIDQVKALGTLKDVRVNILESVPMKISGKPGHKLVYTMTQYGNPPELVAEGLASAVDAEGTTIKMMLIWTIREQKAYILTYVSLAEKYDTYIKDVNAMIDSFRFL